MTDVAVSSRDLTVPDQATGMRLDRLLTRWFQRHSRSSLAKSIRAGLVRDSQGTPLRASSRVRGGMVIQVWIPGLAPTSPPPDFPRILHEDERVVMVDKPPGMMVHPSGDRFVYALIGLAKDRWPGQPIELVHRLDQGTSGIITLTKDPEANRFLKEAFRTRRTIKEYLALTRGHPAWDRLEMHGPIGADGGPIRIKMAVRDNGLPSHTITTVLGRSSQRPPIALVHCQISTGRTHQIRVHLDHAGHSLVGDRLYGVSTELFLQIYEHGLKLRHLEQSGAPRHALHSARLQVPHPDGGVLDVHSELPADMARWWADPTCLPDLKDHPLASADTAHS
ncbi:MAG: 23S rRNA pseudouridine1911/1915/1917 synthase [Kiritimatiellia bacterium]|jgi:23S rRNA pseudouridine1911/1915/1917 synthase